MFSYVEENKLPRNYRHTCHLCMSDCQLTCPQIIFPSSSSKTTYPSNDQSNNKWPIGIPSSAEANLRNKRKLPSPEMEEHPSVDSSNHTHRHQHNSWALWCYSSPAESYSFSPALLSPPPSWPSYVLHPLSSSPACYGFRSVSSSCS